MYNQDNREIITEIVTDPLFIMMVIFHLAFLTLTMPLPLAILKVAADMGMAVMIGWITQTLVNKVFFVATPR